MAELSAQELCELIDLGEHDAVTQTVTEQMEAGVLEVATLLAVAAALAHAGQPDSAEILAVMGLEAVGDSLTPSQRAHATRELLAAVPESPDLQKLALDAHRAAYADRPHLDAILAATGLSDGWASRRSLRVLEVCLGVKVGGCVASRTEDLVGRVQGIDPSTGWVTVAAAGGIKTVSPTEFTAEFDPVDADDFRVLSRLEAQGLADRLQENPLSVLESLLNSAGGKIDRDELKYRLCPHVIPAELWNKWWSGLRTGIKGSPKFSLQGRSPMMIVYHPEGRTLEQEIWGQLAEQPATGWVTVMQGYARQLKQRKASADPALVQKVAASLQQRLQSRRDSDPGQALTCGLVIEALRGIWPELVAPDAWPAADLLNLDEDRLELLADQPVALWPVALTLGRTVWAERWPEAYARLLAVAPTGACDGIADALLEGGHEAAVVNAIEALLEEPADHLDLLAWLWLGPRSASRQPMPEPAGLLTLMLTLLRDLAISDQTPPDLLRAARLKLRGALGAHKAARFREVMAAAQVGLAVTCKALLERLDGLGHNLKQDLLNVIREHHSDLFVTGGPPPPPWKDPQVLYATAEGFARKQAELRELVHVKIKENAIAIGRAAAHGDLSENSEYKFALEERDLLQARLTQMQQEMAIAQVLGPEDVATEQVNVGCRVQLFDEQDRQPIELTILGPWESDVPNRVYSYRAPLAQGLLGRVRGEVVELALSGQPRPYRIEAIESAFALDR